MSSLQESEGGGTSSMLPSSLPEWAKCWVVLGTKETVTSTDRGSKDDPQKHLQSFPTHRTRGSTKVLTWNVGKSHREHRVCYSDFKTRLTTCQLHLTESIHSAESHCISRTRERIDWAHTYMAVGSWLKCATLPSSGKFMRLNNSLVADNLTELSLLQEVFTWHFKRTPVFFVCVWFF